jgi:hypothetical protein
MSDLEKTIHDEFDTMLRELDAISAEQIDTKNLITNTTITESITHYPIPGSITDSITHYPILK